jgi:hypothetical protein
MKMYSGKTSFIIKSKENAANNSEKFGEIANSF